MFKGIHPQYCSAYLSGKTPAPADQKLVFTSQAQQCHLANGTLTACLSVQYQNLNEKIYFLIITQMNLLIKFSRYIRSRIYIQSQNPLLMCVKVVLRCLCDLLEQPSLHVVNSTAPAKYFRLPLGFFRISTSLSVNVQCDYISVSSQVIDTFMLYFFHRFIHFMILANRNNNYQ